MKIKLLVLFTALSTAVFAQVDPPVLSSSHFGIIPPAKLGYRIDHANPTNWLRLIAYTNLATEPVLLSDPFKTLGINTNRQILNSGIQAGTPNLFLQLLDFTQSELPAPPINLDATWSGTSTFDGNWTITWDDMYADSYEVYIGTIAPGHLLATSTTNGVVVAYGQAAPDGGAYTATHDGVYVDAVSVKNGQRSTLGPRAILLP